MHLLTCLILLVACFSLVASLPLTEPARPEPIWPIPDDELSPVAVEDHTSSSEAPARVIQLGDLIVSDQEYQRLLDRLRQEAEQDVRTDPRNYVDENVDAEEIMRMFAATENTSTTTTVDTTTAHSSGQVIGPPDAASVQLNDANTHLVSEEPESSTTDECPICLQALSDSEVETLECAHKFHTNCMNQWALYQLRPNCPICRSPTMFRASRWELI